MYVVETSRNLKFSDLERKKNILCFYYVFVIFILKIIYQGVYTIFFDTYCICFLERFNFNGLLLVILFVVVVFCCLFCFLSVLFVSSDCVHSYISSTGVAVQRESVEPPVEPSGGVHCDARVLLLE